MTPIEKAARLYDDPRAVRSLREDMEAHLLHGMVYSNHQVFMLLRYVSSSWSADEMDDPWFNPPSEKDTLFCYLASGDMKEFFTFPHKSVNWVAFSRLGKPPRVYPYSSIRKKLSWVQSSEV